MSQPAELNDTLRYVQDVVDSASRTVGMWKVYLLWALLIPPGFALADLATPWVGWYWLVVGPLGGLVSYRIAWNSSRDAGHESRRLARLHGLHWAGVCGGLVAVGLIGAATGSWDLVAPFFLVVAGLGWFLGGIQGDWAMMWLGALLVAAAVGVAALGGAGWTIAGGVMGIALLSAALVTRRPARSP